MNFKFNPCKLRFHRAYILFVCVAFSWPVFAAEKNLQSQAHQNLLEQDIKTLEQKLKQFESPSSGKLKETGPSEWIGHFALGNDSTDVCRMEINDFKGVLAGQVLTLNFENRGSLVKVDLLLSGSKRFEKWQMLSFHYFPGNRTLLRSFKLTGGLNGNTVSGNFYAEATKAGDSCAGELHFVKRGTVEEQAFIEGRDPRIVQLERRLQAVEQSQSHLRNDSEEELARYRALQQKARNHLADLKKAAEVEKRKLIELQKAQELARRTPTTIDKYKDFGRYHALVIGIDRYKNLPALKTAVADATAVANVLADDYGFDVKRLINPSRDEILDQLDDLRNRLSFNDNLLIYFSGHGSLDLKADEGYWLPVNAHSSRRSRWISNNRLTATLRAIDAKHVLVIADSCYSGRLTRGISVLPRPSQNLEQLKLLAQKKARVVLTSGGLQPVDDDNGSGHSPFAFALLKALNDKVDVFDGTSLFKSVHRPVQLDTKDQEPQYSDVRRAGHDGGDFIFVKRTGDDK